jgi:pimeloyl-ACP methyl ester carboxylesterase
MNSSLATLSEIEAIDLSPLRLAACGKPPSPVNVPFPSAQEDPQALEQEVRFCKAADGTTIAYATVGSGPPLVKTANWLNHLDFDWESPVWRHIFRGLSDGRSLIRYDARGNGLSDWDIGDFSFERQVNDLESVVDALGLERFPLLGLSQGCAVSVEFAARYPEKISKLILYGGYVKGWNRSGIPTLAQQTEAMITLVGIGWGTDNPAFRQMFTSMFMPDAPRENQDWFNELQRVTTTPKNAVKLLRATGEVDITDRLADVRAPTLVLHAVKDTRISFNSGRELAAGIPGARFVSLNSRNHILPQDDPAWPVLLAEINAFLAE